MGSIGDAEDQTGVLLRQQSLGHYHIEPDGGHERDGSDAEGEGLVTEHPLQAAFVGAEHAFEKPIAGEEESAVLLLFLRLQQP